MKSRLIPFALTLAASLTLAACGGDSGGSNDAPAEPTKAEPTKAEPTKAEPTKTQMIKDLRAMAKAANANAVDDVLKMIRIPASAMSDKVAANVMKSIQRELTDAGVNLLEEKATFGALTKLFPERGERWATRAEADPATSFALKLDGAEVAAFWNGAAFEYLRVDDVAKLK